jgi:hypothetical protein
MEEVVTLVAQSKYEDALSALQKLTSTTTIEQRQQFQNDQQFIDAKNKLFEQQALFDVEQLIETTCELSGAKLVTKTQLKNREKKEYHDTWELVDYFNATTYNVCPPSEFAPNEQELEQVEVDQDPLHMTVHRTAPIAVNLHHQFTQGSHRTFGLSSIAFAEAILDQVKKTNRVPFFKSLNKRVKSFGVRRGVIRVVTTNWFAIGVGGAIMRDYDDHYWAVFKFDDETEINVDFLAAQFGFFTYSKQNGYPLHIFDEKTLKDESHAQVYRVRDEKIVQIGEPFDGTFIDRTKFVNENKLDKKAQQILQEIEQHLF